MASCQDDESGHAGLQLVEVDCVGLARRAGTAVTPAAQCHDGHRACVHPPLLERTEIGGAVGGAAMRTALRKPALPNLELEALRVVAVATALGKRGAREHAQHDDNSDRGKDRTSARNTTETDRQAGRLSLSVCLSVNTCIISCVLSQSAPSVRTEPRRCELLQRARCSEALVLRSSVHLQ